MNPVTAESIWDTCEENTENLVLFRSTMITQMNQILNRFNMNLLRNIVARIETERAVVHGNRGLIRLYEEKVKKVIERVWEG